MTITSGRYAAVTSTIAVIVALGGTSYAATQIGTSQIKANAVTSAKIKNNTVTGQDVKESSLSKVPSAKQATRATTADAAGAVNGVVPSRVFLYTEDSVVDQVLFSGGGLTITASCDAPNFNLDLVATTSKSGSYLSVVGVSDSNPTATIEADAENSSMQVGTPIDLLLGDDGDILQTTFTYSNADGSVVTGDLSTDIGSPICSVRGMVLATS